MASMKVQTLKKASLTFESSVAETWLALHDYDARQTFSRYNVCEFLPTLQTAKFKAS